MEKEGLSPRSPHCQGQISLLIYIIQLSIVSLLVQKLSRLRDALRQYTLSTSTQASSLWLQRLAQGKSLSGDFPLEPLRERLGDLRQHNLKLCEL